MLRKCTLIFLVLLFNAEVSADSDTESIVSISKAIYKGEIDFFDKGYMLAARYKRSNQHLNYELIVNKYSEHCAQKGGSIGVNNSMRVNLAVLTCFSNAGIGINAPLFTVLLEKSQIIGARDSLCYSVLAVENTAQLSPQIFADEVLSLDKELVSQGFYSGRMCG